MNTHHRHNSHEDGAGLRSPSLVTPGGHEAGAVALL